MAPTSVMPFQHFMSPTSPVSSTGGAQVSSTAALFANAPFDTSSNNDNRFHHHHPRSSQQSLLMDHHNHNHHHPSSPSTPRSSYDSTRIHHASSSSPIINSSSSTSSSRWDPSPSALDEVSRGASFTLPPIVSNGGGGATTPRTSLSIPNSAAGPEWDSTGAQYAAAAQWGAYSSSSGAYSFLSCLLSMLSSHYTHCTLEFLFSNLYLLLYHTIVPPHARASP